MTGVTRWGRLWRSPRAWGWTASGGAGGEGGGEIPTRVRMDRAPAPGGHPGRGDPHARGDGPREQAEAMLRTARSPRAWGWTGWPSRRTGCHREIPTRVGMDRKPPSPRVTYSRDPHARGDGPRLIMNPPWVWSRSPRAWGWTAVGTRTCTLRDEIPTRVGMDRAQGDRLRRGSGDPHARGDGPTIGGIGNVNAERSPRAWGWTGGPQGREGYYSEIPTRVGMDRARGDGPLRLLRDPHARGDGPRRAIAMPRPQQRSPRAWGWTGERDHVADEAREIPTRVGMDRA